QFLRGSIDEFRIFDYALNDNQIAGNYQAGPDFLNTAIGDGPPDDEGPVAAAGGAARLIATDIEADMRNVNASAFVRIPFEVADPSAYELLTLRMRYDDGFVAYLNG